MIYRHLRNFRGFFSDYYLGSVFGRGSGRRKKLSDRETQAAYARFQRIRERAEGRVTDSSSCREKFIRPVLRDVLGFHLGAGEEHIHALFVSADAEASGQTPLALCYCGGWDEDLDSGRGSAQPLRRMEAHLARLGHRHGILFTGERGRLVRAAGEGPGGAYLEADLPGLCDEDDPESFAAFHRLFSSFNFLPDSGGKIPIDEIERESRQHAEKVSDDLKQAVFTAAESLVGGLIQDALANGRLQSALSLSDSELRIYRDAALLALYRILFILYAEARDPRLEEHRLYREFYSAQGLVEDVTRDPGRKWPENRASLWQRLRALFHIYDQGLPAITPWENIPPRGGDFFSIRTPEGRILDEARLPDPAVAQLMMDLAMTAPRRGVGREHVSFRELDIENLGAVYEGLLEYEPQIAREIMLEIRVQGRTFALAPADVVRLCEQKKLTLNGEFGLVEGTSAELLHPQSPGLEDENADPEEENDGDSNENDDDDQQDEDGDDEDKGISKGGTARLIRRLESGDFYFVPGPGRKGSGSFYTPRALVQDLVHHALGPLIEGRSATEIGELRVLDPACGSAHFLVEAMRYLGQALHRAFVAEYGAVGPPEFRSTTGSGWDENWRASDEDARASNSEARAWCKRRIAERCLFGVDLNPTAVELARVALWIESVAGDRPLSYFEHHVRPGNSLLGSWMNRLESPPISTGSRNMGGGSGPSQAMLPFQESVRIAVREAARIRRIIDETRPEDLRREGIEPDSVKEQEFKEHLRRRAEDTLASARLLFDLRSASAFIPQIWHEWPILCSLIGSFEDLSRHVNASPWKIEFVSVRQRERFFHWELEFPEADQPGFDAVLGNPPWDKVLPARKDFYARYDVLLRAFTGNDLDRRIRELHEINPGLADEFKSYREKTTISATFLRNSGDFPYSKARSGAAHEDVSKYFLDRAARIVRDGGYVGMLVPSVIYNGDGSVGLRRFLLHEAAVERFYGFENRAKIFPIDSRYKFVSLAFRKGESEHAVFSAAFMRQEMEELKATAAYRDVGESIIREAEAPWVVTMRRAEIEALSPETSAFLEYRSARDQEIVRKMYQGKRTLADNVPDSWRARFISWRAHEIVYNSAEDKDLWTDPASGRLYSPGWVLPSMPYDFREITDRMREHGFWPVFEGKNTDQFLIATKPVRWWLSLENVERKYGRLPRSEPTLVFRRIASNTNERTVLALVLPAQSAASEQLPAIICPKISPDAALAVMNSLCFDYLVRFRSAGSTLAFTYLRPVPVPEVKAVESLPHVLSRIASGMRHISEDHSQWPVLWEADRSVAEAYGLGPADFEHILSSFPVFARKRPAFYAYLRSRLSEWADEAGEKLSDQTYSKSEPDKLLGMVAE